MKRFAVEYYKKSDSVLKKIIARDTIRAVNMKEANEVAHSRKPVEAEGFNIKDVTAIY